MSVKVIDLRPEEGGEDEFDRLETQRRMKILESVYIEVERKLTTLTLIL